MNVLRIPNTRAWRLLLLIMAFSVVSLVSYLLLSPDTHLKAQSSPILNSIIQTGRHSDEYGFRQSSHRSYGSIDVDRFDYQSSAGMITYVLEYVRWDDDSDKLELGLQECLKSDDFMGLVLGSTTYSVPDRVGIHDDRCEQEPYRFQEFEFHNIATNPFPENDGDNIVFRLFVRGDPNAAGVDETSPSAITVTPTMTATATAVPTLTPLVPPLDMTSTYVGTGGY